MSRHYQLTASLATLTRGPLCADAFAGRWILGVGFWLRSWIVGELVHAETWRRGGRKFVDDTVK
ncbi:MAG TPA: hypothetical protein VJ124_01440, partial [Pyrinomonadaceae bacterium]|nr:hypothetical protein [Pyrinomonadaceae bacterium]